ncbi:Regulator of telomere elongation helicase 1 -like protein [Trichinella pseudospiralis]|uniref:Regulator of telomere elongation helicase 1 homolog n=1 Tax=Trichinella pseudospiralis TaxID=6337 RepID=A0A0V0XPA2_TRIPS|nr:Regulator of telomere elongation helicase 1 -like protein [Trichinella pseudospiralis]
MQLTICGILVNFPYEPYPCQLDYMEKFYNFTKENFCFIYCLLHLTIQRSNAALESPTGTGKTLCLLCACLGWLQTVHPKENITSNISISKNLSKNEKQLQPDILTLARPQILYASRTHSQLSQVIKELNKTTYAGIRVCILGSRDQLCIDEEVKAEKQSIIKNHICRAKRLSHSCRYYNELKNATATSFTFADNKVMDIEDLLSSGKLNNFCPFYKAREAVEEADLILMPYNYVLDPTEKVCEESASFSFTSKDFAAALREAQDALRLLIDDQETIRKQRDETEELFGSNALQLNLAKLPEVDMNVLSNQIVLLEKVEQEFCEAVKSATSEGNLEEGITLPGHFLSDILLKAGIRPDMCEPISVLADQLSSYLTVKGKIVIFSKKKIFFLLLKVIAAANNSPWMSRGLAFSKFSSLVNAVYYRHMSQSSKCETMHDTDDFKVYICSGQVSKNSDTESLSNCSNIPGSFSINYWCFSAGIGMSLLLKCQLRSVIVTSGTLSPLDSFVNEMRIPFPICLENSHIVKSEQCLFCICPSGPDGERLHADFSNRSNKKYLNSLGNSIVNFCRIIPQGFLIFFASYTQLNNCINYWTNNSIMDRVKRFKKVFIEPKTKCEFQTVMDEYKRLAEASSTELGVVFFGVLRGKLSEGYDFSDCSARAVVIAGIPFPPAFDPHVRLKRDYLNEQKQKKLLSLDGSAWYVLDAVRVVNQAIGRVIRHKNDFGAIILADDRFSSWPNSYYPTWLRQSAMAYKNFGDVVKALANFFKHHQCSRRSLTNTSLPDEASIDKSKLLEHNDDCFAFDFKENDQSKILLKKQRMEIMEESELPSLDLLQQTYRSDDGRASQSSQLSSVWDDLSLPSTSALQNNPLPQTDSDNCSQVSFSSAFSVRRKIKIKRDIQPETSVEKETQAQVIQCNNIQTTTNCNVERKENTVKSIASYIASIKQAVAPSAYANFVLLCQRYKEKNNLSDVLSWFKETKLDTSHPQLFVVIICSTNHPLENHSNTYSNAHTVIQETNVSSLNKE